MIPLQVPVSALSSDPDAPWTESAVLTFKQTSRRLNLIILNVIWYKDSGILIYIKEVVQNEKSF